MKPIADEETFKKEFKTVVVRTVPEYLAAVLAAGMTPQAGTHRPEFVFRGMDNASHRIVSGLDRVGMDYADGHAHHAVDQEFELLTEFARLALPHIGARATSMWSRLAIARHYGLPTRLIDWSYSPLVGAYFATLSPHNTVDRVVWRLHWTKMQEAFYPWAVGPFSVDGLEGSQEDGGLTENWWPSHQHPGEHEDIPDKALILEPPALDARIVAQQGVFSVCRNAAMPFDLFLLQNVPTEVLSRFVIPKECVVSFRNELEALGITAQLLFPDLDGVARSVTARFAEVARLSIAADKMRAASGLAE